MNTLQRIPTVKLKLGMYVSDATPGLCDIGLNRKGMVSQQSTLDKLQCSEIKEFYIDPDKGISSPFALPIPLQAGQMKPKVSLEEEREKTDSIYTHARSLVGSLMRDVKMGNAIEVGPVEDLANEINASVLNNASALMCLSQIREKDQYLLQHSINVGLLMSVFSWFLGYAAEDRHELVTGALLHDIGKIRVPTQILNKPGKLSDAEWQEMRNHVQYGEETLVKSKGISDVALAICAQHHEKQNGEGYPRGLSENEISTAGRIASVVDIYDAITADRVYHQGKTPFDTIKVLAELAGPHLDSNLVYQFIHCVSLYPVGSLVELSNGRLAAVIQVNHDRPKTPMVCSFFNTRSGHYEKKRTIDLAIKTIDLHITKVVDPRKFNINMNDFI